MPLPPEILKLKRKRNEEPVDLLYIQHEGPQPKRSLTELKYLFERVPQNSSSPPERVLDTSTTQINASSNDGPRVPTIRATLPGEENEPVSSSAHRSSSTQNSPTRTHNEPPSLFQDASFHNFQPSPRPEKPHPPPRRFHLSQETMAQFHHRRAANIRIHKRDHKLAHSVPVFSERVQITHKTMKLDQQAQDHMARDHTITPSTLPDLPSQPNIFTPSPPKTPPPRRRPIKTPAEKKWQEKNWTTPASLRATNPTLTTAQTSLATTQRDYEALKLAYELQKFEEEKAQAPRAHLKYQPRPTPRRYQERMASLTGMDVDRPILPFPSEALSHTPAIPTSSDDESDYVIDLYIRKANPHASPDTALLHGFLVIEKDEEEIWWDFQEADEDAEESDSEDSNKEGPDYPEEDDDDAPDCGCGGGEFEDEGEEEGFSDDEDGDEKGMVGRMRGLKVT